MEYVIVCTVALFASGLTLFSGFGLGTILMPVLAVQVLTGVLLVLLGPGPSAGLI